MKKAISVLFFRAKVLWRCWEDPAFMPDYSIFGRMVRFCIGIAVPIAWLYFAPFGKLFAAPFGLATLGYLAWAVAWLLLLLPLGPIANSLLYMAFTGRDAAHFWDPE